MDGRTFGSRTVETWEMEAFEFAMLVPSHKAEAGSPGFFHRGLIGTTPLSPMR